jgi:type II secretory pathway pseudopilin PulG
MSGLRGNARATSSGFTLVELMVSLTGGLFISLAVFALARDSGRFYQREARIANATVGGLLGFERLRSDIARAGYLSSPNAVKDPGLCVPPSGGWPAALQNLASIQINTPTKEYAALKRNGRTPPSLLLAGSYSSADVFTASGYADGNNTVFKLGNLTPSGTLQSALLRLGNGAAPNDDAMQSVFPAGRTLRIVQNGHQQYAQIASAVGGASPTVTVSNLPPIEVKSPAWPCGLEMPGSAASQIQINVVNFVEYNLGTPQTVAARANYADLYAASNEDDAGVGEGDRTELLRLERDINGDIIEGTEEIVAEYAVDFDLRLTVDNAPLGNDPSLFAPGALVTYAAPTFGSTSTPDRIRSVRVRLGVRSREGDRGATIASPAGDGLFRFNLGTGTSEAFARVRTFQADVVLHNQANIRW